VPATLARDVAGRRYALAVMDMARADSSFAQWAAALDGLESLTQEPQFVNALQGDGMTDEKFQAIVRQVVPAIREPELNLLRLLRRKSRLSLGPSIASYFRELWDEERGIERAVVRTAVPIGDAERESIAAQLARASGKQVQLEAEVDASLIGGAVIRVGDNLIDGSTRTRLRALRERLEQGIA
jgi:F-type H+-transporting ATPase subunit delta